MADENIKEDDIVNKYLGLQCALQNCAHVVSIDYEKAEKVLKELKDKMTPDDHYRLHYGERKTIDDRVYVVD